MTAGMVGGMAMLGSGARLAAAQSPDKETCVSLSASGESWDEVLGGFAYNAPRAGAHADTSELMQAIDRRAARTDDPPATRRSLLAAMRLSHRCYAEGLSPEEFDALVAATHLLPPGLPDAGGGGGFQPRFTIIGNTVAGVWVGDGLSGPPGQAARARLTYSFPADNPLWGSGEGFLNLPNGLNNTLITHFGSLDLGREWIRQAIAAWKRCAGVEYQEVADSGIAMDTVATRRSAVGDVRIGGMVFLPTDPNDPMSGTLAYNNFPGNGSDMVIDLAEFTSNNVLKPDNNYRYFRNVLAHEHGHGLGFIHQVPCDHTKLMEPSVSTAFDTLGVDDRRGAGATYGDRYSGNNSAANAVNLGTFPSAAQNARLERDLSTNGMAGPNNSDEDWFRFTVASSSVITITMTPTGGTYVTGEQISGCNGGIAPLVASNAGDLDIQLRDSTGATVIATSTNNAGSSETITQVLSAGTYTLRVYDFGPNAYQTVQLYDLTVGLPGPAAPYANAGLNKRIGVGELCYFMGDVNSLAGTLPITSFFWDLDGDGVNETSGARPITAYGTPGIRTVKLTVMDASGSSATDTITVTVIGSAPSVDSVSPSGGFPGQTIPVTINGSSFGSGTVTIGGTGVTITGTPSINAAGTQITGLSFVIAAGAPAGGRNLTVTTPSGATTASNIFTVGSGPTISNVNPTGANTGQTVPVTITGTNLASPSVSVSGTGVTVTGSPTVLFGNTQITGLSFVVAANATPGFRNVVITNVSGTATGTGMFEVRAIIPANDLCANAITLGGLGNAVNGTTANAAASGQTDCGTSDASPDVYYSFTPVCTARYRFETPLVPAYDTVVSVHSGCPATLANSMGCSDDYTVSNRGSRVDVDLVAGTMYLVRVSGYQGASGAFQLTPSMLPPANNLCAGATAVPYGVTAFNSCSASSDGFTEPACSPGTTFHNDLWYTFTASRSGRTTLSTCGTPFDTVFGVYANSCPAAANATLACNDDDCGTNSRVSFQASAGTIYYVRVGSYYAASGGAGVINRYCPGDFNESGALEVQDIFDFLNAWFAGNPSADFNGGGLAVQDIFDFLNAWFAGC
jgi:hypothetical protein